MRILVVEDEIELQHSIAEGLRLDAYAVDSCGDGFEAQTLIAVETYDLIILDLNLPGPDGFSLLKELRRENGDVKVLILSARDSLEDKIQGLDLGANDYLTKPFHFAELEARVRGLLRRQFTQQDTVLTCGDLCADTSSHVALAGGQELPLTRKEYAILEYLLCNPGKPVSAEELIDHVWDSGADGFSNSLRVHVAGLRKKLRAALNDDPIRNKIGVGYYIEEVSQ
ncbi:MAG: response regulator transcription factor [Oscillospiraceae bacterium]